MGNQSSFYESCFSVFRLLLQPKYLFAALALALGGVLMAPAAQTSATPVDCDGSRTIAGYNRETWCGFFENEGWTAGPAVRGGTWTPGPPAGGTWVDPTPANPGIPDSVDTAQEFVDMILDDFHNGDARAQTGARFIILSTLGEGPASVGDTASRTVTPEQIAEWQARVLTYADISDNGSGVSTGQNGSITWHESTHLPCGSTNTYYQIDQDDVAPFLVNDSNTPDCVDPDFVEDYITFRDEDDNILLQVRRECMNPAGEINELAAADPLPEDGTLGDLVFEDADRNGVFDPSVDSGIPGVTIALYSMTGVAGCDITQGQLIATTTTDADGRYQFTDLPFLSEEGAYARYAVMVTDDNGILNGYTNSRGADGVNENGQDPNGYCLDLAFDVRSNQTGDFGYYRADGTVPGEEAGEGELAPTGNSVALMLSVALSAVLVGSTLFIPRVREMIASRLS